MRAVALLAALAIVAAIFNWTISLSVVFAFLAAWVWWQEDRP